ncbi:MAG TPA: hypothetical protein VEX11_01085 [Acetobacteraceae bacterium]|jgi:hypothetical protein|nr:hypothetical protein [Acetobacteraceae bacterium]
MRMDHVSLTLFAWDETPSTSQFAEQRRQAAYRDGDTKHNLVRALLHDDWHRWRNLACTEPVDHTRTAVLQ